MGPDLGASLFYVEYERLVSPKVSLLGRLARIDYEYDDGVYVEEGSGPMIEMGVRFYPSENGLRGFYIGGGAGFGSADVDWTDDKGEVYETTGTADVSYFDLNFNLGSKIMLGPNFHIEPSALIGNWFVMESDCTRSNGADCDTDSELGLYAIFALSVGVEF